MKLMIIGYARHGKDTLAERLPLSFESSSMTACRLFLYDTLRGKYGYNSPEECFNDRGNHRKEWYDLIKSYNASDPSRLARDIYRHNDVYCGLRDLEEYLVVRDAGLFDLSIWVDASGRLPPESKDSMTITRDLADIVIENNGTLEEFEAKIDRFVTAIGLPPKRTAVY